MGSFRVFAKMSSSESFNTDLGPSAHDDWQQIQTGIRVDVAGRGNSLVVTGGANSKHVGGAELRPLLQPPYSVLTERRYPASDFNLTADWHRTEGFAKGVDVLAYFSHDQRDDPGLGENQNTFDVNAQIPFEVSKVDTLTAGVGFSSTHEAYVNGTLTHLAPTALTEPLLSAFVHNEWRIRPRLTFAAGSKAEHNRYTGWEFEPSASLTWNPNSKQTVWTAISRSVQTPSVADEFSSTVYAAFPGNSGPDEIATVGSPNFQSEVQISEEVGWRCSVTNRLTFDSTAFYNQYTKLRSFAPGVPTWRVARSFCLRFTATTWALGREGWSSPRAISLFRDGSYRELLVVHVQVLLRRRCARLRRPGGCGAARQHSLKPPWFSVCDEVTKQLGARQLLRVHARRQGRQFEGVHARRSSARLEAFESIRAEYRRPKHPF